MSNENTNDPGGDDFAAMLAEFETQPASNKRRGPSVGDTVSGPVVSIGSDAVFIDLGAKSEAMLDAVEVSDADGNLLVKIGDVIEARVVETGGKSGCIVLRKSLGKGPDARGELSQAFELRIPVEGTVMAVNKGGFDVQVGGVRTFCPVSQIDSRFVEDPAQFVGQKFSFRITRYDGSPSRPNIVVSRRVLLEEEAAVLGAELRNRLSVGLVLDGTVSAVKDYGAFVDLGGLEGMLHISELGHTRVDHPSDILRVGQKLTVQVLKIEQTGNPKRPEKIGLSLKSMEKDPWQDGAERFAAGTRVRGPVTRLAQFGAFVELAPGVEGLVHISELGAGRRINHPREVVSEGATVEATVLSVDLDKRRISLSIGAMLAADEHAEEQANIAAHSPKPQGLGTFADLLSGKKL